MSTASSESEQDADVQNKQKVRKSAKRRSAQQKGSDHEDEKDESISEKLNELLSDSESETNSDSDASNPDDEDVIELDENGCVQDFNIIADALEQRRIENKTFNDLELRDIERKNSILMNKILSHNKRPSQYKVVPTLSKTSSSSINRKKHQQQIEFENLRLLKKIQTVKPFGMSKQKK